MRSLSKIVKFCNVVVDQRVSSPFAVAAREGRRLKSGIPCDIISSRADEIISQAKAAADEIMDRTQSLSGQMLREAAEKGEEERQRARREGYEAGYSEGVKAAQAELEGGLREVRELIHGIEVQRESMLLGYEEEIKGLALNIAKKIVESELQTRDRAFLSLYKSALSELNRHERVKITVSPHEEAFASLHGDLLKSLARDAQSIKVEIDRTAEPGTCIVETDESIADASLNVQLGRIGEALSHSELWRQ